MKLVIYGSDTFTNITPEFIVSSLSVYGISYCKITEVVHGAYGPVDEVCYDFIQFYNSGLNSCELNQALDPYRNFHEDTRVKVNDMKCKAIYMNPEKHGKHARTVRNKELSSYGDALLLIWNGSSKDCQDMKRNMIDQNKPVYEVILGDIIQPRM